MEGRPPNVYQPVHRLGLPKDCLSSSLAVMQEVLRQELPLDMSRRTDAYLTESIGFLRTAPTSVLSFIDADNPQREVEISYPDTP